MTATLSCKAISKSLGGKTVLANLDIEIAAGEVVSLLGASGSGKTTLLRAIAGLHDPDEGTIRLDGKVIWSRSSSVPAEKRRIGMVFQDYALWPHMTVEGNLAFGLKARKIPQTEIRSRIAHALEVTRLSSYAERHPAELSGGQQQRVAIARCLAARPALMLFDEPLSNLDAALREDMRGEMMEMVRREGITVIYVTHDQSEAMAVSDRIAVMREGRITQFDTPARIYDAPANAFVASFIGGFSLVHGRTEGNRFFVEGNGQDALAISTIKSGSSILVVRPEDARPAGDHPGSRFTAKVRSRAFQGRCWRLGLDIGGHKVRIDWPEGIEPGKELTFSLPPERCVILTA